MQANDIVLDALDRIRRILQRALTGLTLDEVHRQPSPDTNSMGWLTWHLTRVQDNGISGLAGQEQAWISQGWHAKFHMDPDPENEGAGHTPEQVAAFRAPSVQTLLDYHDSVLTRSKAYVGGLAPADFERTLDQPQYQPLPTVGVRLVSVLSDNLQHAGQVAYLRGLFQGKGWMSF
ncbi:MAG TPA: DinB family protein [Candidatus Tectomicrobia bacterium]